MAGLNDLPDTGMPGSKPSLLDSWRIERLWSRPLGRLGTRDAESLPGLADLRRSLRERAHKSGDRGNLHSKNTTARKGLLADLARHDRDET